MDEKFADDDPDYADAVEETEGETDLPPGTDPNTIPPDVNNQKAVGE